MPNYTQADRIMRVDTTLGADALLLEGFTGEEGISMPFRFTLDLRSEDPAIDAEQLLRTAVTVTLQLGDGGERTVHGRISRFVQLGRTEELTSYEAEIVPWLWFLGLSTDCRVFQNLSVLEIVEQVFDGLGYADYEIKCTRSYAPREYCVQYRETHLSFVSRLLEEEGIFYFFQHADDKHMLILADAPGAVEPCPGQTAARFATQPGAWQGEDVVTAFVREHAVQTGKVTLRDYDYLQPALQLEGAVAGEGDQEAYDYPGGFTALEQGERCARLCLEEYEARRHVVHGESTCRAFSSGYRFDLREHYRGDSNQTYQLIRLRHVARGEAYASGAGAFEYHNSFVAIPHRVPYRPPRRTRKPVVRGSQTAMVVGKSGEEVWVDQYGRVKLHFYWDRLGQRDENSSCWVRVSTPTAGKGWGSVQLPRIGQEVVVDFLEGDPDRPIITGSVFNADQMPPFSLPGAGIQMGMKSHSSPGGGGFNEISMTDTKGQEGMTVHAQYDMSTTVEHDQTLTVHNNRTETVDGTHTETVKKDTTVTISEGNLVHNVAAGTASYTVKKKITIDSTAAEIHITAANEIKLMTGASTLVMAKDGTITLSGKDVSVIGSASVNASGPKVAASGTQEVKIGVGAQSVTCDTAKVQTSGAGIAASAVGTHEITGAIVKIN